MIRTKETVFKNQLMYEYHSCHSRFSLLLVLVVVMEVVVSSSFWTGQHSPFQLVYMSKGQNAFRCAAVTNVISV